MLETYAATFSVRSVRADDGAEEEEPESARAAGGRGLGRRLGAVHGHLEQPGAALEVRRKRRALPEDARLRRHRHGLGVPGDPR